jgi:adenylate cyclase class 2
MHFEVEQKHRVADVVRLTERLAERGSSLEAAIVQSDRYFAHPARDFAKSDEALRIRTVGDESFVTYKGPKIDATSKTRRELEFPLSAGDRDGAKFAQLLAALGFTPVATVRKRRRPFMVNFEGRHMEGALDEVDGVGTFAELELMADDDALEQAKLAVAALAIELDLGPQERRSYLEMLLAKST